ncbi:MAG: hypothetical protein M1826_005514 [Phylliscum demangeonii]|nr:MAG: hypothetical protein M1826_005514 [Phylliscum demangeonii]
MEIVNTSKRLEQLRSLMTEKKIDIYVVPSEDSHQSEYIAPCDARRGCAVVTLEKASLATDGRYFNQAEKQLDSNWTLLKQGLQDVPTWQDWTAEQSEGGKTVGVDPTVITAPDARVLDEKIKKKGGSGLSGVKDNLIDIIWGKDRPQRPANKVKVLGVEFAGKVFEDKLKDLRAELEKKKSPAYVACMLDEVAWLYNLRGSDIPYNPVFYSYAIITEKHAELYVDANKLADDVRSHLEKSVTIKPYESIFTEAQSLNQQVLKARDVEAKDKTPKPRFLIPTRTSWALSEALGGKENVEEIRSPIGDAKAVKNEVEVKGMKACHVRDGAALIEYFAWLEDELVKKAAKLDEVQAADKLEQIRSTKQHFVGLSFDTISSTGANAAVIHYKPERGSCATIDPKAIYLCDSGAQYLDGTTDTTRTLHFSEPTKMERKAYTLVLKGNIAINRAVFPKGTSGLSLDSLARQFLWEEGMDYRHGTGHGVGSYLNVHEGPIGIGTRVAFAEVPLAAGNVISDDIIIAKEVKTNHTFGDKPYLGFDYATLVPMCRKLIDEKLLTSIEKGWLNTYHEEVREKTKGFFDPQSLAMKWLERETQAF